MIVLLERKLGPTYVPVRQDQGSRLNPNAKEGRDLIGLSRVLFPITQLHPEDPSTYNLAVVNNLTPDRVDPLVAELTDHLGRTEAGQSRDGRYLSWRASATALNLMTWMRDPARLGIKDPEQQEALATVSQTATAIRVANLQAFTAAHNAADTLIKHYSRPGLIRWISGLHGIVLPEGVLDYSFHPGTAPPPAPPDTHDKRRKKLKPLVLPRELFEGSEPVEGQPVLRVVGSSEVATSR